MADVVVGPVIDKLVELLLEEANLFKGVHRDVESLKDELETIKCFLKDAEARLQRGDTNDGVKIWVKQVSDQANRIEDVIDEYIRHVAPRHSQSGFIGFLRKVGRFVKQLKARHDVASEARDIKTSLREIKERRVFQFSSGDGSREKSNTLGEKYDPRLDSYFLEEDDLVGIDSTRDELISKLFAGESTRAVISLVGSGGIGKTTLANQVYNNEEVKKHFICRAWITVSQSYDTKKLLKSLTNQICIGAVPTKVEIDEIQELIKSLRQYLKEKRYLVVFDDVWDLDCWDSVKHVFPKNDKGGRVIVTTRNNQIGATACQESSCDVVHNLQPLSKEMAWDLFCKNAFQSKKSSTSCPKDLEELSCKIIDKCEGLPLAITAIARLMATKEKTVLEWQRIVDNISSEYESNRQLTSISKILSLSYNDLPHHLKSCFLYFGIFPEDYLIAEKRLYRLWIAEGFVKPKRDKLMEDIAEEYLEELIHRNLVEVSYLECEMCDKMCKVHDMMREIILPKVDELGFCQILDGRNTSFKRKYRRLSINGSEACVKGIVEDSTVRSIFVFNVDGLTKPFVAPLFKKFKLLRVLDFRDSPLDYLPKEVGNLFHLKYLDLSSTKLKALPKSIGKLQNLQTLDISQTLVRELPFKIDSLLNMRHFLSWYWDNSHGHLNSLYGVKIMQGIGSLAGLQTLCLVEAYDELDAVNELEKLRHLRFLSVLMLTTKTGKALCGHILSMEHLDCLMLSTINEEEILDLESISSPLFSLRYLTLRGTLLKLPHWISDMQNLFVLRLEYSNLHYDALEVLQCLPNLQFLLFLQTYNGERLHFTQGGFKKLKELTLRFLVGLKEVEIDRGALPHLEKLKIGESPLKQVPAGIEHLTNLKTLRFLNMPEEFVSTIRPEGGQDYVKVMHVSSITLCNVDNNGFYRIARLRDSEPLNFCCTKHFKVT